jgi:flavodoxin/NAD-dependent dihydropyrimidine dehydrogenase PreA subunit
MNALIVYFTQTGNTEQVARAIGRGLDGAGAETVDLATLREAGPRDWLGYDLVALGTPVFYYKEPVTVRDWIASLAPRPQPGPVLTFNTNGGNPTNTFRRLRKQLKAKGGRVIGSFECLGYDTYPIYLKSFRQWGRPNADDLAAAEAFGRDMAETAGRFHAGDPVAEPSYPFVGGKYFRLSWICRRPVLNRFFPKLNLDEALCTACGACARACPTENIRMVPGPQFLDRCIRCYLCERVCPQNAIQCDWRRLTRMMNA